MRRRRTILGISASLDGDPQLLVPEGIVPFPRGFAFGHDGSLYLASGIGPSGEGDNTIVVFDPDAPARPRPLVTDPGLSPLDMTLAPNGHILVASESPFRAPDAVVTIREYDPANGDLVRVFAPDRSLNFRQPRGLRFGPEGHLYCVGEAHVVAFDFSTGDFLGSVVQLPGSTAKHSCCSPSFARELMCPRAAPEPFATLARSETSRDNRLRSAHAFSAVALWVQLCKPASAKRISTGVVRAL